MTNEPEKISNVVMFPGVKQLPESEKLGPQIRQLLTSERMEDIEETVDDLFSLLIECLAQGGVTFNTATDDTFVKDLALNIEAMRSLLCKFYGMEHPLQNVSENIFIHLGEGRVKYKTIEDATPEEGNTESS